MCWPSITCDWSCRFSTCSGSFRPRVSGLKSTTAFMQANSVGSTANDLKRPRVSCSARTSRAAGSSFPGAGSGTASSGQLSRGMDHWMAQSRNSSLHASSNRITWGEQGEPQGPCQPQSLQDLQPPQLVGLKSICEGTLRMLWRCSSHPDWLLLFLGFLLPHRQIPNSSQKFPAPPGRGRAGWRRRAGSWPTSQP